MGYVPELRVLTLRNACTAQHKTIKLSEFLGNTAVGELDLNFLCEKVSDNSEIDCRTCWKHVYICFRILFY
jgi:hypothetical protein